MGVRCCQTCEEDCIGRWRPLAWSPTKSRGTDRRQIDRCAKGAAYASSHTDLSHKTHASHWLNNPQKSLAYKKRLHQLCFMSVFLCLFVYCLTGCLSRHRNRRYKVNWRSLLRSAPASSKKKRYAHARKNLSVTNKRVRKESSSAHFVCIRRHANRHRLETMPLDKVLQVVLDT